MLLTKRLPSPLRRGSSLVRRGDEDSSSIGGELRNAEGSTGPKRRRQAPQSRQELRSINPRSCRKPAWRSVAENIRHHSLRDAAVEPDVRPEGGQPRNHRHHDNRKQRLVHANELNRHWNIHQQCFSTHPVAEHAERARDRVESRRGVGGDACGSCLSISVDVQRHFERCSATEYGSAVSIVLRPAPALPPCGSRFLPTRGNQHGPARKTYRRG
jgi:hypothetical protein